MKQLSIEIPITDDQQTETDEPLVVSFSSEDIPADRQDMIPNPTVIIIDNDISECIIIRCHSLSLFLTCLYAVVGFAPTVYSVTEGVVPSVTLTVFRTGNVNLTANVTFMTVPGSAECERLFVHDVAFC